MVAEIIVSSNANELNRTFDYNIPQDLHVTIGMRVLVPFARRKEPEIGYVINIKEASEYNCKSIVRVVDNVFDETRLSLAKYMSKKYFCNISDTIKLLVPPGTGSDVDNMHSKQERWVKLKNIDIDVSIVKTEKQKRVVEFLLQNVEAPASEVAIFTDVSRDVLAGMQKKEIIEFYNKEVRRNPFFGKRVKPDQKFDLNQEQANVISHIDIAKHDKYLIHGITGSGKTEVYLQLIEKVLLAGKTALVLVPEISLTPQITDRFIARFGNVIAILHSKLSIGERYDEWQKIKKGEAKIVIGARSAVFAPLDNIGVIIIDEEHDSSYKSDMNPKYDTREVALFLAKAFNAPLVLGSATPDVKTYYSAQKGEIKLLKLTKRATNQVMPDISVVDMREELATGNRTIFSRKLYNEINANLAKKEQVMLFLNRRGYSTFVMCRDCGEAIKCDECDISMTYHHTVDRLICHYCGRTQGIPSECPKCKSKNIRYFGSGTQKVEEEIKKYFPQASVLRMDVDTTKNKNGHEKILNEFRDKKIDILLGTQMITKGHDFENVTLVGILAADGAMHISDYRANERTYQLLTQTIGRAGRGDKKGRAVVQTYMPDEFSIVASQKQSYEEFYNVEINMREKLNYPPFCDIIISIISGEVEEEVINDAELLHRIFSMHFKALSPIPAPISKINGSYRWRIIIKEKLDDDKRNWLMDDLEKFYELQKSNTKLSFDINPNSMS